MKIKNNDESSLSDTRWNCMYHIVFIPKYRRKAIYNKLRRDIGKYIRRLCEYKGVEIVEANACPDHIHMLVKIPPKMSISSFMGYLKGKSSLMIFEYLLSKWWQNFCLLIFAYILAFFLFSIFYILS